MKKIISIIIFSRNYRNKVINFQYLCDVGLIDENHLSIFKYADRAKEAWSYIKDFHDNK